MDDHAVAPYRFPTTVLIVDDDPAFLDNFSLELPETLAFRLFESPGEALSWLQDTDGLPSLQRRCFHQHRDTIGWPMREHLVRVDLAALEEEVTNPDRFREVSVVVADYAMPEMNGLELCRRLADRPVRRVLLTGVGDEKLAVSAFNEGLIDRFVIKNRPSAGDMVNRAVSELQREYFQDVSHLVHQSLAVEDAPFLSDPVFARLLDRMIRDHGIVEHYFVAEPNGFLMLTAGGHPKRLVVMTEADLAVHWEIARDQHAPSALMRALSSRDTVPYFWRTGGYYRPSLADWEEHLYPAETVEGMQRYYVSLIDDPPAYRELGWTIASYQAFLERLDREQPLRRSG